MSEENAVDGKDGPVIVLEGAMTVAGASAVRDQLLECVNSEQRVQIRTADIDRVDSSVLQLIAVFIRQRAETGRQTEWVDAGEAMTEALKLSGLEPYCGRLH